MPGSAGLVLVAGVAHLDEAAAVFEAMLTGWGRQQRSRLLGETTIADRMRLVRRFTEFAESYPWAWGPGDVEDFTVSLTSGSGRLAPSTIRGYHLALRMFCDYLTDARYEWPRQCRDRFDQVPVAGVPRVEHRRASERVRGPAGASAVDLRRAAGAVRLPRRPGRADRRVGPQGRPGGVARRADDQDRLRVRAAPQRAVPPGRGRPATEPARAARGAPTGRVHVRYGKAVRGGVPRRRTVLAVPEFDWVIDGTAAVGRAGPPAVRAPATTRRCGSPSGSAGSHCGTSTSGSPPSGSEVGLRPGADAALPAALLRHPSDRVRLPGTVRPGTGRARLRLDHRDLHLGLQRLQEQDPAGGVEPGLLTEPARRTSDDRRGS